VYIKTCRQHDICIIQYAWFQQLLNTIMLVALQKLEMLRKLQNITLRLAGVCYKIFRRDTRIIELSVRIVPVRSDQNSIAIYQKFKYFIERFDVVCWNSISIFRYINIYTHKLLKLPPDEKNKATLPVQRRLSRPTDAHHEHGLQYAAVFRIIRHLAISMPYQIYLVIFLVDCIVWRINVYVNSCRCSNRYDSYYLSVLCKIQKNVLKCRYFFNFFVNVFQMEMQNTFIQSNWTLM